jgi:sigma-B regulation protein RsbU (phosphoserine phosphatase)
MTRRLNESIEHLKETTAAKERLQSELQIAHEIQMSMVPKTFPPFPDRREFDIFATLVPAREVGGDLYDFFFIDDDHLCFAVGDVSGKGVPAALFMAVTKTLFKATAVNGGTPGEILARLNAEICRDNESCMFVTLFCAILNTRTGQVDYSNGGHNLPYYLHRAGVSPLQNTGGIALGLVEQSPYASGRMVLGPGEALLLYTDGVTEAMNPSETLYSDQRLERFLVSNHSSLPRQIIGDLVSDVRHFAGTAPQSDDITVLALHYFGTTEKMTDHVEIKLTNKLSELDRVNQTLTEFGRRHGLAANVVHDLNLALEEILANIISYGYTDDREHEIRVNLSMQPGELSVEVEDDGQPFNPLEAPEPDTTKPLEERTIGGLGIHLVRKLMDGLEYNREDDRNLLTIKKKTQES